MNQPQSDNPLPALSTDQAPSLTLPEKTKSISFVLPQLIFLIARLNCNASKVAWSQLIGNFIVEALGPKQQRHTNLGYAYEENKACSVCLPVEIHETIRRNAQQAGIGCGEYVKRIITSVFPDEVQEAMQQLLEVLHRLSAQLPTPADQLSSETPEQLPQVVLVNTETNSTCNAENDVQVFIDANDPAKQEPELPNSSTLPVKKDRPAHTEMVNNSLFEAFLLEGASSSGSKQMGSDHAVKAR